MTHGFGRYLLILGALLIAAAAVWLTHNYDSSDDIGLKADTTNTVADTVPAKANGHEHPHDKPKRGSLDSRHQAVTLKGAHDIKIIARPEAARVYSPSQAIALKDAHDITISGKSIAGGNVPCISLVNCSHVRITSNRLSNSTNVGVWLYNCHDIIVDNNYFADVSTGVYAEKSSEGKINIEHNSFLNMQGPFPRGQFVQFNNINGAGNNISYNNGENLPGESNPEDAISLYKCNGTAASPILVKQNRIRGGGPSKSGGGIMLGDSGGSYLVAEDNILVDPGQYGIAISGGDHNSIIGNTIFAKAQSFTNVGIYVAGYNGATCTNSMVAYNKVHYLSSKFTENSSWLGPNADKPLKWETNSWNAHISGAVLPAKLLSSK